jgi:MFS family permease
LYLSELAPAHIRGRAVGFCAAGVAAVGVVAVTIVWGTERIQDKRQYVIPLALQAALPIALALLSLILPESPLWDIQKGNVDRARRTLMSIRNHKSQMVEAEISMYQLSITKQAENHANVHFWDILKKENINRTLASGAMLCASQVGGQILILTYSTVTLVQTGVGNPFQVTIIISCLQLLGVLIGPVFVDKLGRRPVILFGVPILLILNIAAGSLAATGLTTNSQRLGIAAVFIIFGFFNAVTFQSL